MKTKYLLFWIMAAVPMSLLSSCKKDALSSSKYNVVTYTTNGKTYTYKEDASAEGVKSEIDAGSYELETDLYGFDFYIRLIGYKSSSGLTGTYTAHPAGISVQENWGDHIKQYSISSGTIIITSATPNQNDISKYQVDGKYDLEIYNIDNPAQTKHVTDNIHIINPY